MVSRPDPTGQPTGAAADGPGEKPAPKLELNYPCAWVYTVIGEDESLVLAAVDGVVGQLEHTIEPSKSSSSGRYQSFRVEVTVRTDHERLTLFRLLHEHADVRYVL